MIYFKAKPDNFKDGVHSYFYKVRPIPNNAIVHTSGI